MPARYRFWAAVRFSKDDNREWVDPETISIHPEVAKRVADHNDSGLPMFFAAHPVVRIAEFEAVEVKRG